LNRIARLARLTVYIAGAPDFGAHAVVADGVSGLLASVFDGRGGHVRLAIGAMSLPGGMPIELEMIFELG
jgi:hypothetical protein